MTRQKGHDSCQVVRRMLVTHGTMRFNCGADTYRETGKEWVTRACAVPLFSDEERARGECRSCASGWTHPNNYRAEAAEETSRES